MYSGITLGLFSVTAVNQQPGLLTYVVKLNSDIVKNLSIGASVAVDGVCQSVEAINNDEVTFTAMAETLQRTTLNTLSVGRKVSIETSLRYGDVIGGHEIAGHVMGTAEIVDIQQTENNVTLTVQCPHEWLKYIFTKGFIAVDGSSLTVGTVNEQENTFMLHLIPETLRVTNFAQRCVGDKVNIELDFKTQAVVQTVERILPLILLNNGA